MVKERIRFFFGVWVKETEFDLHVTFLGFLCGAATKYHMESGNKGLQIQTSLSGNTKMHFL